MFKKLASRTIFCLVAMMFFAAVEPQAAAGKQKVTFPSADGIEISGILFRPRGDEQVPGIVAMHGCGGLFKQKGSSLLPAREDWARRFVRAGYAVLFPDSYSSRKVRSLCNAKGKRRTVKLRDHVRDLIGAATWLADQNFIDRSKIALIGWGVGGAAALRVLDPTFHNVQVLGIKAAVTLYPNCIWLEKATDYVPAPLPLILMGAADDWLPLAPCKTLSERWGSRIELYPDAYHNFDVPNVKVRVRKTAKGRVHAGTNPAARKKAIKEVMDLFEKAFTAPEMQPAQNR